MYPAESITFSGFQKKIKVNDFFINMLVVRGYLHNHLFAKQFFE